jgi:hypothetical protein
MRMDSFVSDGVESLVRLTKYARNFPFSSDYSLGVSEAPRHNATSSVIRGYLGTEERQPEIET